MRKPLHSVQANNTECEIDALANPLSLFDVTGKVAIVCGATGSFAHGCAKALGALGVDLLLASGTEAELEKVAEDVASTGANVATCARRADSLEDAEAILAAALEHFGRVDQLVVGSGLNKPGFIQEMAYDDWQEVMDANLRGPWFLAKVVGSWFIENSVKGKVLFMSSVRGRHGNYSGYTAYCSSRGALDSLTRVLGTEWGQYGITVNAIAPTVFRSKLTDWMWGDDPVGVATRKRSLSRIPLGRLAEVEDLVGMALYLLAPASDFCTGQVIYIDGGYTAG